MTADDEPLSMGEMAYLISRVREGTADPSESPRLLAEFVRCVNLGVPVPAQLIDYLRNSFASYLNDGRPLPHALGLAHSHVGKPGASEDRALQIAISVLHFRLAGKAHQEALEVAGKDWSCGKTKAGSAWKSHRAEALLSVRSERAASAATWTKSERDCLRRIFKNTPEVIPELVVRTIQELCGVT